jgi:predicted ATPase
MCLYNPRLFVVTGGLGSGKTTLLNELAKLGFPYALEVARQIIKEQIQAAGTALPWDDREAYTDLMLQTLNTIILGSCVCVHSDVL